MICENRIIVFDLDETLGYFTEFGIFWDSINEYIIHKNMNLEMTQELFNKIFDLYPEFMRPNILLVLNFLKQQKEKNNCKKILIYTNNQGPKEWVYYIKNYFEHKINYNLFEQIISAFKVNGEKIELCRTTNYKSKQDLLRCTKINEKSKICFIDDTYYPEMTDENIYYINLKPYIYDIPFEVLIERLLDKKIIEINDAEDATQFLLNNMNKYNYIYVDKNNIEYNVDKILTKKLYKLLMNFFSIKQKETNKKTKKNIITKHKNKTKKIY